MSNHFRDHSCDVDYLIDTCVFDIDYRYSNFLDCTFPLITVGAFSVPMVSDGRWTKCDYLITQAFSIAFFQKYLKIIYSFVISM